MSFVDNPRHSDRPTPSFRRRPESRGGDVGNHKNHKNHTNHSSDNPLRAPSCPSWTIPVIPTAHPSFRRRPESRGAGTWGITKITKITRITVQTTPFAPLRALRGQSPSFQPPTRHSGEGRNPGAGTWGIPLITKITRITVQTTPFAPLRGQSPSFQPPTRHSGGGRNPEGRGGGTSHQSQKSHESQFRQLPSRPFVDNPRHSNRPPVIPAKSLPRTPIRGRNPEGRGGGTSH